ncbi:hypothetical protein FRB96_001692 [Tulasnella sp. 330]|nr:hypothetical protein FRB96_001692 [Tulasnella sp. 330]KAG8888003.1 hypothetical protein FRB98_008601 [Tulasnella sp. 332]
MSTVPRGTNGVDAVADASGTLTPTSSQGDAEQQALLRKPTFKRTPLPKKQLAIICFCRLAEPIAFTQIFPYINTMVEELRAAGNPADVGFYSGLVDSLFSVAQLMTIFQWGRLSDRIGRRPVIISGLTGVALASLCFGLSTSFWQVLAFRAMAGGLTGNVAVIQSMIGEITDETNQAQAFPLGGVMWNVGCIVGPFLGGYLSHPSERYPAVFGQSEFLKRHTLPSKVAGKHPQPADDSIADTISQPKGYGTTVSATLQTKFVDEGNNSPPSAIKLLSIRQVQLVVTVGFFLSFSSTAWETVFILFAYTPISFGGLERNPAQIGTLLSSTGLLGIFVALVGFPTLQNRFGTMPLYRACMALWIAVYILFPITSVPARWTLLDKGHDPSALGLVWTGVILILGTGRLASMGFPANMIMVKAAAPNKQSLGATFGLSQSVACIARAAGPAFVSSLFAFSVNRQVLGGQLVWLVMTCIAITGFYFARRL